MIRRQAGIVRQFAGCGNGIAQGRRMQRSVVIQSRYKKWNFSFFSKKRKGVGGLLSSYPPYSAVPSFLLHGAKLSCAGSEAVEVSLNIPAMGSIKHVFPVQFRLDGKQIFLTKVQNHSIQSLRENCECTRAVGCTPASRTLQRGMLQIFSYRAPI